MAYGMPSGRNPLAWPGFATEDDVRGLPHVMVSVNEFDALRDGARTSTACCCAPAWPPVAGK